MICLVLFFISMIGWIVTGFNDNLIDGHVPFAIIMSIFFIGFLVEFLIIYPLIFCK